MRNFVLALAIFIVSSVSFAEDLPIELDPLSCANLSSYKQLLRQFAIEDQAKDAVLEHSMAHLTAHETEIDELAALGLYEIPTLFTDWLICRGEYVIGCYSVNIPVDEFLLDPKDLVGGRLPVTVLERFTYPPKYPYRSADPFESGYSVASMKLLKGVRREGIKEAIEAFQINPYFGMHPCVPFFKGGRFYQTTTKHPFRGVVYK